MKVSIALATYNGERWLREQLDSLARQTLLPCELVVSDDQSTDRTLEVVREFAATSPFPVRIVDNDRRRGFADNFIHALRSCTGDAVAYCDQDDVWNPLKLERCVAAMRGNPKVTLVQHDSEEVDSDLRSLGIILRPNANSARTHPARFSLVRVPLLGCCMLVRRNAVDALVRYWPTAHLHYATRTEYRGVLSHDQATLRLAIALGEIAYVSEALTFHREHRHNTCSPKLWVPQIPKSVQFASSAALLTSWAEVGTVAAAMSAEMASLAKAKGDAVVASYLARVAHRESSSARFCAGRAALYSAKSRWGRLAQFSEMVRSGVYRGIGGPLVAARSALKDFLYALAGPAAPQLLEMLRDRLHLDFHPRELSPSMRERH